MENRSNANLTPAQKAGFQVGDSAIVIGETNGFSDGQRVTLYEDDGTNAPLWRGDNWEFKDICAPGVSGAYLLLNIEVRRPTEWDWTPWPGGGRPVDGDTLVDARRRDGKEILTRPARNIQWRHYAAFRAQTDIVEYRLSLVAPELQSDLHAESYDGGTLTGAALHRAIADAMDAGDKASAFETKPHAAWNSANYWSDLTIADEQGLPIRRKPAMRSATLPDGEVVEWPAPMTTEPAKGSAVWVTFDPSNPHIPWHWLPYSVPELLNWLESGFCHDTREARDQAERAFVALNRGTTDAY